MPGVDQTIVLRAAKNFSETCHKLKVTAIAPFYLGTENTVIGIAFLPHYGGPNGMVVGAMDLPKISPDSAFGELAKEQGFYRSFMNASAFANKLLEEKTLKDALEDWGYYGPRSERPAWFAGYDHSTGCKLS